MVYVSRMRDPQDDQAGGWIGRRRRGAGAEALDHDRALQIGVADIKVAVARELRVEDERQQPAFAFGKYARADVEVGLVARNAILDDAHPARPLGHEQAALAGRGGEPGRIVEIGGDLRQAKGQRRAAVGHRGDRDRAGADGRRLRGRRRLVGHAAAGDRRGRQVIAARRQVADGLGLRQVLQIIIGTGDAQGSIDAGREAAGGDGQRSGAGRRRRRPGRAGTAATAAAGSQYN